MSAASSETYVSARHAQNLGYGMIVLATNFVIARYVIKTLKRHFWLLEDAVVILAWVCLSAMCIGYIVVTPAVYRIAEVVSGQSTPYATLKEDAEFMVKIFFPNTLLLWCCLWLVKCSLLLQCRRIIDRQPSYMFVWWCIVAFSVLGFIGCVVSEFTSCESLHAWFTFGLCQSERDARAAIISLYYSFAVDVISDLMIMAFPVRILWNLKLSRLRKLCIMAVFCVGIICISASIVRVVQIGSKSGSRQPSASWLAVWAMVEGAIAVVVACLSTFGLLLPSTSLSTGYSSSSVDPKTGITLESFVLHGDHRTFIQSNASRDRLTGMVPDRVVVNTTFDVEQPGSPCSSYPPTENPHQYNTSAI